MIENSIYLALAASFLFGLPQYKKLIESRKKTRQLGWTPNTEDHRERMIKNYPGCVSDWRFPNSKVNTDLSWSDEIELNFFNRKPFTCLICTTFWLCIVRFLFILFLGSNPVNLETDLAPALTAPIIAESFTRWFKSLPISI